MIGHSNIVKNKEIESFTGDGVFDFTDENISSVTIQNAGNVTYELHGCWYFPPGASIQIGMNELYSIYKDKIKVKATDEVIEKDPQNPVGPKPLIQAWPIYMIKCQCQKCN